jgi:aminopeptidase 2
LSCLFFIIIRFPSSVFLSADTHEERLRALRALGFTPNATLLQKTLDMCFNGEVRSQDIQAVFASVCANPHDGRERAWQFLQSHWSQLVETLGSSLFLFSFVVSTATKDFTTSEKAIEVEKFFEKVSGERVCG